MKSERVVEIIDADERFQTGVIYNFGKIMDKVGTYRKDLIEKFNDSFEIFMDKNQFLFDKIDDVEGIIDDKIDYVVDKMINYIDRVSESVHRQSQNVMKNEVSSYELQSMGCYDDSLDDKIVEFNEFKLEDYDTDEYKGVHRGR